MKERFGYRCEYCEGTVREKRVERKAFKHRAGFVILEDEEHRAAFTDHLEEKRKAGHL